MQEQTPVEAGICSLLTQTVGFLLCQNRKQLRLVLRKLADGTEEGEDIQTRLWFRGGQPPRNAWRRKEK